MKWLKYIWILLLIWFVCTARTCNEDEEAVATREGQQIKEIIENIKTTFTNEPPPDSILRAYEITAVDKLYDFADYLKIISDTTIELKFRLQAAELTRDLFVPGRIGLNNWSKVYPVQGLNTLELLLDHCLSEGISCWIQPSQINVNTSFMLKNDSTFTGALFFYQDCISFNNQDTSKDVSEKLFIDIYLIKRFKQFGDENLSVWGVYLGDTREAND